VSKRAKKLFVFERENVNKPKKAPSTA